MTSLQEELGNSIVTTPDMKTLKSAAFISPSSIAENFEFSVAEEAPRAKKVDSIDVNESSTVGKEIDLYLDYGLDENINLTMSEAWEILFEMEEKNTEKSRVTLSEAATIQLFSHIYSGDLPSLRREIGSFPDIKIDVNNSCDYDGVTLLHLSCYLGTVEITQFLVENAGGDVEVPDFSGRTCLHYACLGMNIITIRYLVLFCSANVFAEDNEGQLASTLCMHLKHDDNSAYILEILRIIKTGLEYQI